MFKRTIAALTVLVAMLCFAVKVDAADGYNKDDTWLIYWYACGANNLEGGGHLATKDIAEMQRVKLPPNIKILIYAGSTQLWHHPTIKAGGHGIYLYSANHLEKQADWHANMGDPSTLAQFLKFGEENFPADHKVMIFWDHGGMNGVCYDDSFNGDGLSYDELNKAFSSVYGNSPENPPFELVGFKACLTGSYELANSIADFSRYMVGSEPSIYDWYFGDWIDALVKDPSMNGAQIGKAICDYALKSYDSYSKATHTFSVIDLTKMPELRTAYENYFDEALARSNEEAGFSGAFARAANARNVDKYSNIYADLGLIAKNTKAIMPEASERLLNAIDKAVVYNKRGAYIKSKGISTYYPYISSNRPTVSVNDSDFGGNFLRQNSSYSAQKELYRKLLDLNVSNLQGGNVPVERNSDGHLVAKLELEQMENISTVRCVMLPVKRGKKFGSFNFGETVLTSADDLKIDWKKGTVTENFRAVEPVFDGHKIAMFASVSGRGHTFYEVPIILSRGAETNIPCNLKVRYDTSAKKYTIFGFGEDVENGMVRDMGSNNQLKPGDIITPIYLTIVAEDGVDPADKTILTKYTDPETHETACLKLTFGEQFVYTRDSAITAKTINKANYLYFFGFIAPNGQSAASRPGLIQVKYGEVNRFTEEDDIDEDNLE